MKSILQIDKECYRCGQIYNLEKHHIFKAANRKNSEQFGLWVWLCAEHHRGNDSPHMNRKIDLEMMEEGQRAFEVRHGNRQTFMAIFGKNYLSD